MINFALLLVLSCLLTHVNPTQKIQNTKKPLCELKRELDGQEIGFIKHNFTKLSNPNEDTIIQHGANETIALQLCSTLHNSCKGQGGYSVCLKKNGEEKGIGKSPPNVINDKGKIIFNFTGDDCKEDKKYTVIIFMKCDYTATNNTKPEIIPQEKDECSIYMMWRTSIACSERKLLECKLETADHHYDLSSLMQHLENYVIPTGDSAFPKIILNVCHSVIFEHGATCLFNSPAGACLQRSENEFLALGSVENPLFLNNGYLTLEYENGGMCEAANGPLNTKITITFICDRDAQDTLPRYVSGLDDCNYQLMWRTSAACSIESERENREVAASNCTVNNSVSKYVYDLNPLSNKDVTVTSLNGEEFTLRVCKSQEDKACKQGTGVCLSKNKTSFGSSNADLMWNHGGPYLNYTNGELCQNGGHRYTLIAFICGVEGSPVGPIVVENRPCSLIIHWVTELACEQRVKCLTEKDGINLTPLIGNNENYVVKTNDTKFYINICRPLLPKPGLLCPPGVAVCGVPLNSTEKFSAGTNLGFPENRPYVTGENRTVLSYANGSPCKENSSRTITTNFTFLCDYSDQKAPEYKGYKDCTYLFEWKTSFACSGMLGSWTPACTIKDEHSHEFDLKSLSKEETQFVKNKGEKQYSIALCNKTDCGSAICLGKKNFGSLSRVVLNHSQDTIRLQYFNSTSCNDSSYMSEIRLVCNASISNETPTLLWENNCSVGFEWRTKVACSEQPKILSAQNSTSAAQPAVRIASEKPKSTEKKQEVPEKQEIDKASSSLPGVVGGISVAVVVGLIAFIYWRKHDRSNRLCPSWNPFGLRRSETRVQYSRVNTTEEARLLLDTADPTECQSDSDEDLLDA